MVWVVHAELAAKMLHSYGISVGKPVGKGRVEGMDKRKGIIKIF
jgi:hypothetical protein